MDNTSETEFLQSEQDMLFLGGGNDDSLPSGDMFFGTSPMITEVENASDLFQSPPPRQYNASAAVLKNGSSIVDKNTRSSPEESSEDSSSDDSARHKRKSSSMSFETSNDGDMFDPFKVWANGNSLEPALTSANISTSLTNMSNQEMSNEDMEIHFDFKSAASSPRPTAISALPPKSSYLPSVEARQRPQSSTGLHSFRKSPSASQSPPSSIAPRSIPRSQFANSTDNSQFLLSDAKRRDANYEAVKAGAGHFTSNEFREVQQASNGRHGKGATRSGPGSPALNIAPPIAPPQAPYQLYVHPIPPKSRVETQIPMKLTIWALPERYKKIHLPTHTISKPKLIQRPKHENSADTLELYSMLVCTSAMSDNRKRIEALHEAASKTRRQEDLQKGTQIRTAPFETDDPHNPLNGGEVSICSGCITRERKRAARKKSKKPEEEAAWAADEFRRVVVFNTNEVRSLEDPEEDPDMLDEDITGGFRSSLPKGSRQIKMPMRIACYCRHHNEKLGFQVILTLKDHQEQLLAQAISQPIMITDDHKAQAPTTVGAPSSIPDDIPSSWMSQDFAMTGSASLHSGGPLQRNAFSSNDLQAFNYPVTQQQQLSQPGFRPFATAQVTAFNAVASNRANKSRQASPTNGGPINKKRKASGTGKIPESLIMTKSSQASPVEMNSTLPGSATATSYSLGTSAAASPFSATFPSNALQQLPPNPRRTPPYPSGPPTPDSATNDLFSHLHRSQSFEASASAPMFSQPPSALPSRAPSPTSLAHSQGSQSAVQRASQNQTFPLAPAQIQQRLPVINKLIPAQGPISGGIEVTLLGSGFYQGLEVMFGDALATTTTYWGESTLVCLLPPADRPGQVPVTLKHQYEQIMNGARHPVSTAFTYVDGSEQDMLRQALILLGQKVTGRTEDAGDIVNRVLSPGLNQNLWSTYGNSNGQHHQMSTEYLSLGPDASTEDIVLQCLNLLNMDDGLDSISLDLPCDNGQTLLHLAASLGYRRLLGALLANGADPNLPDRNGFTPLHMASLRGHSQVVRRLLFAGANPSLRSLLGFTPIELATDDQVLQSLWTSTNTNFPSVTEQISRFRSSSQFQWHGLQTPPASRAHSTTRYDAGDEWSELSSDDNQSDSEQVDSNEVWDRSHLNGSSSSALSTRSVDPNCGDMRPSPLAALLTWRNQLATQVQQFQQSFDSLMPQLPIPALPNLPPIPQLPSAQAPAMVRRISNLVPQRSPRSTESNTPKDAESRWWDIFSNTPTSQVPPPAYDDIYPQNGLNDLGVEPKDATSSLTDDRLSMFSASKLVNRKLKAISTDQPDSTDGLDWKDLRAVSHKQKRLINDRNLFFIWIPLLVFLISLPFKDVLKSFVVDIVVGHAVEV